MADSPLDHVRNKFKKRFQEAARQFSPDVPPSPSVPDLSVIFPHPPPAEQPPGGLRRGDEEIIALSARCKALEEDLAAAREKIARLGTGLEERSAAVLELTETLRRAEERVLAAEKSSLESSARASAAGEKAVAAAREMDVLAARSRSLEEELSAARERIAQFETELRAARAKGEAGEGLKLELDQLEARLEEQSRLAAVLEEKRRQAEERAEAADRSARDTARKDPVGREPGAAEIQELRAQMEEIRTQRASLRESYRRAEQEAASWRQRFVDLEDRYSRQGKELSEIRTLFQTARKELDKLRAAHSQGAGTPAPDLKAEEKASDRAVILHELEMKFNRQSKILQEIQRAKEEMEQALAQKDKDQQFLSAQLERLENQNRELVDRLTVSSAEKRDPGPSAAEKEEIERTHRDLMSRLEKIEKEAPPE